jgi:hypothetical protein
LGASGFIKNSKSLNNKNMSKMDAKLLIPFAILLLAFLGYPFGTEAASVSSPTAPKKKAAGTIHRSVDSEEVEEDWPNIEALLDRGFSGGKRCSQCK